MLIPTTPISFAYTHSLGGLLHLDYNDQYTFSYEGYFDTIRRLGLPQADVDQASRRLVFSVATINFDDHLENFAFQMDSDGKWKLSPAYDVVYEQCLHAPTSDVDKWQVQRNNTSGSR